MDGCGLVSGARQLLSADALGEDPDNGMIPDVDEYGGFAAPGGLQQILDGTWPR
jgi:hypothetical protein